MSEIFSNLDWSFLTDKLLIIIPALICIVIHEVSHGFVAYLLGDDTAKSMGRLTLNPIKHLDILGLLSMMFIGFGWAKPVPINMYKFKNPKRGMALSALAGPVSNLLIAVVFLFMFGCLVPFLSNSKAGVTVLSVIVLTARLSIGLAIFNILPIPPMDGSKILFSFLSDEMYNKLMHYERFGMILIFILAVSGKLWAPLGTAIDFVYNNLTFIADAGFRLVSIFL